MTSVCITGAMGCGKSHVCRILAAWGHPVYNCDHEAQRIMLNDPQVMTGIRRLIGPEAYQRETSGLHALNKPLIAQYLYASPRNAERLNAVVHPAVREDAKRWLSQQQGAPLAFIECAIPRQSGIEQLVEHMVRIEANPDIQWERIRRRDNLNDHQIQARLAQQEPELTTDTDARHPSRQHVLNNNGDTPIEPALRQLLKQILETQETCPQGHKP